MANNNLRELIDFAGVRKQAPTISPLIAVGPNDSQAGSAPSQAMLDGTETPLAQTLLELVSVATAPVAASPADDLTKEVADLRLQLIELNVTGVRQVESIERNTSATTENTSARSQGLSAGLELAQKELLSQTGLGGLLLSPIAAGLSHLFSGGGDQPDEVTKVVEPPPIRLELATPSADSGTFADVRRGIGGLQERVPATQVTINVSAIDSRSFLDHSDAIAQAVREAMLNTHSLNDVVGDL